MAHPRPHQPQCCDQRDQRAGGLQILRETFAIDGSRGGQRCVDQRPIDPCPLQCRRHRIEGVASSAKLESQQAAMGVDSREQQFALEFGFGHDGGFPSSRSVSTSRRRTCCVAAKGSSCVRFRRRSMSRLVTTTIA